MTKKVITFGEVMMRLSPPGYSKFSQATSFELVYGGGEANVAISCAYLGMKAAHVTRFPDNALGRAATQFLRQHWLSTEHVFYGRGYFWSNKEVEFDPHLYSIVFNRNFLIKN